MVNPGLVTRERRGEPVPASLSSILLVEANPELRDTRRLLLSSLMHPVLAVSGYREVCELPAESNCRLVAVNLWPNEQEAQRTAAYVRRAWPWAKILLLGRPSEEFDDPLYDEALATEWSPLRVIEASRRLLES